MQSSPRTWAPLLSSFILGLVVLGLLVIAAVYLRWIKLHIPPDLLNILVLAVAYGLYALRKLRPLAYGTPELMIGVLLVVLTREQSPERYTDESAVWALAFQLSAGIYIAIRGLDNMAKSPLVKSNARARWFFECLWWRKWKE